MNSGLSFLWQENSKWQVGGFGFYAGLIITNVPNGISAVRTADGAAEQLNQLGHIWVLEQPANYRTAAADERFFEVEVIDVDGQSYGTYRVEMICPPSGECSGGSTGAGEDAPAVMV